MKEVKARKIELATVRLIIRTPQERDVHDIFVLLKKGMYMIFSF